MRAVVQRVRHARVTVAGEVVGQIDAGMLILLGVLSGDTEADAERLALRIAHFRFFEDPNGRMNLSALDGVAGSPLGVLLVSQFTLAADGKKGRRPSFDRAEHPERARELIAVFARTMQAAGLRVEQGRFGAEMQVDLSNDGPVTFSLQEGA